MRDNGPTGGFKAKGAPELLKVLYGMKYDPVTPPVHLGLSIVPKTARAHDISCGSIRESLHVVAGMDYARVTGQEKEQKIRRKLHLADMDNVGPFSPNRDEREAQCPQVSDPLPHLFQTPGEPPMSVCIWCVRIPEGQAIQQAEGAGQIGQFVIGCGEEGDLDTSLRQRLAEAMAIVRQSSDTEVLNEKDSDRLMCGFRQPTYSR